MASYGSSSLRETDTKKAKYLNISILSFLYPDPGSNRDGFPHWCLRPARLPIPPSGQIPPCLFAVAKVLIIFELTNFLVTFFSKNAFLMQKH